MEVSSPLTREYSRRHVLAGLGTVGVGLGTSVALFTGESHAYTTYTRVQADVGQQSAPSSSTAAQQDQHGLRVAWWESYNGRVLETQGDGDETDPERVLDDDSEPTFVPEANGPIVTAGNVLPGDEGTVGIGIKADIPGDQELAVWFRTELTADEENGINEPESKHPDEDPADPGDGEMDEFTRVTVWEDSGLAGIGANDGRIVPVAENELASGTLREVFDESALADGIDLGCLASGETTYVSIHWELPPDVGNVVQSDSATFDLEFRAARCDAGSPFEGSDSGSDEESGGEDDG
jgi:hypothetical protein